MKLVKPLFSIITATYYSEKTIEETIQSILNQSCNIFEYLIIDGGSKDQTIHIIKKYEPIFQLYNISFTWISEPDTGIYNAWNKGVRLAKGDWISFLGSDDIYLHNALEEYAKFIMSNSQMDFVHSKVKLMFNNGAVKFIYSDQWNWNEFKKQMKIAHVGSFHNRKYFDLYGDFDETFVIAGDYEMLLRAKSNLKVGFIDSFTAEMKDGGISNKNALKAFKEAKTAKIHSGHIKPITAYIELIVNLSKYYVSKFIRSFL